jgi:hypothetical protein
VAASIPQARAEQQQALPVSQQQEREQQEQWFRSAEGRWGSKVR